MLEGSAGSHLVNIQDGEFEFFEGFTTKNNLPWHVDEKLAGIISISSSLVGYIRTPKRRIELPPKYREINLEHVVRLHNFVNGYSRSDDESALDLVQSEGSFDIAKRFLSYAEKEILHGIYTSYKPDKFFSRSAVGRVNYVNTFERSLKLKRKPYTVSKSRLTLNNSINQLLVGALVKISGVKQYSHRALDLLSYFESVQPVTSNAKSALESISLNPQTARFGNALKYAVMIIDQMDVGNEGSLSGTDSFLINFDLLFEQFVAKSLIEYSEERKFSTWPKKRIFGQIRGYNSELVLTDRVYQPDILYGFNHEDELNDFFPSSEVVLDVKNKANGTFKNQDLYQVLTYSELLNAKLGILIYPAFFERPSESFFLAVPHRAELIGGCFVNISSPSGAGFISSVHEFVMRVEGFIDEHTRMN